MNPKLWATYAVLEVLLSLSPGPAVLTVFAQGLRHGWRRSLFGNLGILSGNVLYFALSALGVGAFIAASPALHGVLRWGGIVYLVWMALGWIARKPEEGAQVRSADGTPRALYVQALTTQLANPKAIIFFVSFLAPFLDTQAAWPVAAQIAVYAATSVTLEFPILLGYGLAASQGRRLLPAGRASAWEHRIAGACLLGAALWLALR